MFKLWLLILSLDGGVVTIPLDNKDTCVKAIHQFSDQNESAYCLNTETGEVKGQEDE